jgi:hypothetical protein
MKKIIFLLSIGVLLICSSFLVDAETEEQRAKSYSYTSWSEIDLKTDSILFKPYGGWNSNWLDYPLDNFNYSEYQSSFIQKKTNLWNLIHEEIITNKLQIFYPFNPNWYMEKDNGRISYPVFNLEQDKTFLNDREIREEMFHMELLGKYGAPSDMALTDMNGYDSLDNNGDPVYPPRDIIWYDNTYIIKYQLREEVFVNKKGKEIGRDIKAIAPIIYEVDEMGNIRGERALFWMNFQDLSHILEKNYMILAGTEKVISYRTYFEDRLFKAKVIKDEKFKVNGVK